MFPLPKAGKKSAKRKEMTMQFRKRGDSKILADNITPARTPWARMKGLLGKKRLAPGEGIWLVPCNSIHMLGMSIPLDVLFLDRSLRVLKCFSHVKPGTVIWPVRGAHSVLELGVGSLALMGDLQGETLFFETVPISQKNATQSHLKMSMSR